ncbi:hypothetical protein HTY54_19250 [Escherichia coli]|nr:hypothetical protein [Escherichia coli]
MLLISFIMLRHCGLVMGATFVTGADQDIQSIDAISSGTIDISDGTVFAPDRAGYFRRP